MKKLQAIAWVFGAVFFSASLQAEGMLGMESQPNAFAYNFVEVSYVGINDFGIGDKPLQSDLDGFRLKASYDIDPNLSVIGSLLYADDFNTDLTEFTIGAAYHQQLPKSQLTDSDFIIHAAIEHIDVDMDKSSGKKDDKDTGLLAGAMVRIKVVEKFEVFGDLSFRTAGENDLMATVGGRYAFTPRLLGLASVEISDSDILSAGIRYNY